MKIKANSISEYLENIPKERKAVMQELISTINKNLPKGFKEDACEYFYNCKSCGKLLKAQNGDCCVFCTYGNTPCPSIQEKNDCCK